jgi:hypothetical protein
MGMKSEKWCVKKIESLVRIMACWNRSDCNKELRIYVGDFKEKEKRRMYREEGRTYVVWNFDAVCASAFRAPALRAPMLPSIPTLPLNREGVQVLKGVY